MLNRHYQGQICSVARTLEVVGDRWTLLVIRDALRGTRRFDDFQAGLGVARNVLTDRLTRLCEHGLLEKQLYQTRPARHEYVPTRKGLDLWPTIMSLIMWGDRHLAPDGPPLLTRHRGCGGALTPALTCDRCGASLGPADVELLPGPGAGHAQAEDPPA
ncbi:winged helix-turn-helix transcriptional regulator [Nonomuraea basaltis]|uniref:winged helix-turn-helix transcriptional regulator n=1 Tax=Nonomuraea basaltis TaxID=2495887 RepID=UPI00110C5F78|nr:helix-turn-helix domain-containing protein [Nonomuraea basaltis]TMR96166.1 helix-turn-helix transcriptional regulator [Nonomuraea basaltis]